MCLSLVVLRQRVITRNGAEMVQLVENSERTPEMVNFEDALREVMTVSKEDLKRLQEAEQAQKTDKPRRGPKPKSKQ